MSDNWRLDLELPLATGVIDWLAIGQGQAYYLMKGYEYVEVPWLVPEKAVAATKPPHARDFMTWAGALVASGEQSFLAIQDSLEAGRKYQCVTPCFRDEEVHDDLHLRQFVKLELIHVLHEGQVPDSHVEAMIADAHEFIHHFSHGCELRVVRTEIGYDIEVNRIEVGSYGYREHDGLRWVYGTGIAEPRLCQAQHARRPEGAALVQGSYRRMPGLRTGQGVQGEGVRAEA